MTFCRSFGFGDKIYSDTGVAADSGVGGSGGAPSHDGRRSSKAGRKRTAMAMTNGDVGNASPILPGPSAIIRRRLEFE